MYRSEHNPTEDTEGAGAAGDRYPGHVSTGYHASACHYGEEHWCLGTGKRVLGVLP